MTVTRTSQGTKKAVAQATKTAKAVPRKTKQKAAPNKSTNKIAGRTTAKTAAKAAAIRHWSSRRGHAAQLMVRSLAALLLSLCAIEILRLTLAPSPASVGIAHANLHPFATIRLYLRHGSLHQQILQIGGNVAIGVPLGFLLPQITPRLRGLLRILLVTCVFIVLIELAQWLFVRGRAFDVDDVICAAAGAALGYLPLGRMFGMRLHPDHLHPWQRLLAGRRAAAATPGARPRAAKPTKTTRTTAKTGMKSRAYSGARGGRSSRSAAAAVPRRAGRGS